jgi:hypothetical protein
MKEMGLMSQSEKSLSNQSLPSTYHHESSDASGKEQGSCNLGRLGDCCGISNIGNKCHPILS